jgi:hypothetical protein
MTFLINEGPHSINISHHSGRARKIDLHARTKLGHIYTLLLIANKFGEGNVKRIFIFLKDRAIGVTNSTNKRSRKFTSNLERTSGNCPSSFQIVQDARLGCI